MFDDDRPGSIRSFGGRVVRWMWRSGHRDRLTADLVEVVAGLSGRIIDIGGGRDSPLAAVLPRSVERVRVDITFAFKPDVQGDGAVLPLRSEIADAVIMSEVLEHISEPHLVMAEVLRILKPGGVLVGSTPFLCQGIHADPADFYRYTSQALTHLMGGFDTVEIRPHGNAFGVAWRMVLSQFRFLMPLNPLVRQVSRHTDPTHAEGYTFVARKASN